jgi:hypothetical protein
MMGRSMTLIAALLAAIHWTGALATSGDQPENRGRDWHGKLCTNCQPAPEAPVSRIGGEVRIATKLVAPNTCADPGPGVWFAEEEDHLSAFLNSAVTQYK